MSVNLSKIGFLEGVPAMITMDSQLHIDSQEESLRHWLKSQTMTGELNTVEQVAELAMLLAGPAGRGITGAQLSVDGGIATY